MPLKSMLLKGFKSFADKTEFRFDKGITCIVGPNGCGKSNIVDAFLWILGEPSAKSLRGHKMQDIIFAGTSQRKSVNLAEASLTICNGNKILPIEYEEVTITRRLHRDGDSEYLLNQRQVRLKDIHHLLRDSGIGHQAFAIFEQGKIDEVIRFSPIERRFIFEEAAGVSRFLHRKQESLKRLELVQANLERARDITLEVEKQVQSLSLQAEAAKIYQGHIENLQQMEKTHTLLEWDKTEKKRLSIVTAIEQTQAVIEKLCKEIQTKSDQSDELLFHLNSKNDELKSHLGILQDLKNQIALAQRDLQLSQDRIKEAEHKYKSLISDLKNIDDFSKSYALSINTFNAQLKEAEIKVDQQKGTSPLLKIEELEKELISCQKELQNHLKAHSELFKKNAASESECKQLQVRIENEQDRLKRTGTRRLQLQKENESSQDKLSQLENHLKQLSKSIISTQTIIKELHQHLASLNGESAKLALEKQLLVQSEMEKQARQKVLVKMQENHEGFSESCKKLLIENERSKSLLFGKLSPLFQAIPQDRPEVRKFIAEAGIYSETLVVQNLKDLDLVIQTAKTLKLKEYSIICLELVPVPFTSLFANDITCDATIKDSLKKMQQQLPSWIYWSQDGFHIDSKGVIFHRQSNQNHPFFYEKELIELNSDLQNIAKKKKTMEIEEKAMIDKKTHLSKEKMSAEKTFNELEKQQWGVQSDLKRIKAELEKWQKTDSELGQELVQIESLISTHKSALETHHSVFVQSKNQLADLQLLINQSEQSHAEKNRELKLKQQEQRLLEEAKHKALKELQQIKYQLDLLEVKQQENLKNKSRVENDIAECHCFQDSMKHKHAETHSLLLALNKEFQIKEKVLTDFQNIIQDKKKQQESVKQELNKLQNSLKKQEQEFHQKNLHQAEATFIRESLERAFQEKYEASILEFIDILKTPPLQKEVETKLSALKEIIKQFGAVNMTSIEELAQHRKRYEDLVSQMNDLERAREEILKIISQLDEESRKIFKNSYELIRQNFQKNFQILFEGGEANLQLVGSGQIMDAGIEILAKPPGKQLKTLSLLSGGEKCLTALALLFAIFEVKPSPFCILDEIDAPLDDANVDRFIKMVRSFSDQCQFLVITHNKRTMAIGNSLWGISMEEKGVSKLLTLQLQ